MDLVQKVIVLTSGFFEGDMPPARYAIAPEDFSNVGEKSVMGLRVTRKGAIA